MGQGADGNGGGEGAALRAAATAVAAAVWEGDDLRTREPAHSSLGVYQGEESTCAALEEMRGEQEFERRAHTDSTIRCC